MVVSGVLWQHEYTLKALNQEFDAKFALQPYTVEVYRDAGSAQQYTGCQFSSLEFNVTPNQDLRTTMGIIGISETDIAASTPTFPTSPTVPFAFDTASVSIAGTANPNLESLTITIDNQLQGIGALANTAFIAKIRRSGFTMVRISGDIAFETTGELNQFRTQAERRWVLSLTRANSFQLIFDLPRVVYTAHPVGISGRDRVVASFEGMGRFHQGSGNAIKATLTTVKSDY
jgi:hypothetical protein